MGIGQKKRQNYETQKTKLEKLRIKCTLPRSWKNGEHEVLRPEAV